MTVSAFIRSYRGDFRWLQYCLRALAVHGRQFCEVVVVVPDDDFSELLQISTSGMRVYVYDHCTPHTVNGYIDQQITKCHADQYCKGDFVMHFDSDCIATSEIKLADYFVADRPKLLIRQWQDAGTAAVWAAVTSRVLKEWPAFETMASHPFVYHRSTHELFRRHVENLHGPKFGPLVASWKEFSEFNAIGNFCHRYTPDAYHFVRAGSHHDDYPRPFRQFWSRGEFPRETLERMMP